MENKHDIKIIDGVFTPLEAGRLLAALIASKINYHRVDAFSNEERLGYDPVRSQRRVEFLREANKSIKLIMEHAFQEGYSVKLSGSIEIKLVKEPDENSATLPI